MTYDFFYIMYLCIIMFTIVELFLSIFKIRNSVFEKEYMIKNLLKLKI